MKCRDCHEDAAYRWKNSVFCMHHGLLLIHKGIVSSEELLTLCIHGVAVSPVLSCFRCESEVARGLRKKVKK